MQTTNNKIMVTGHSEWKNTLGIYVDNLTIYKNRLVDVATSNKCAEIAKQVAHFQNQFYKQQKYIDSLKKEINEHLQSISNEKHTHEDDASDKQLYEHEMLSTRLRYEQKLFKELKVSYMEFLGKVM